MRANFTRHSDTAISIKYKTAWDTIENRTFEQRGSYVWELYHEGRARQICKKLAVEGETLQIRAGETLWSVLHREYRLMQAADKRAMHHI